MKSEDTMTREEAWLEVHRTTNNQMKDELLHIWTWIVIWDESSFNVSCQLVTTLKRWFNWQTSAAVTIYDCQEWRKSVLCWLNWWHEMKHEIHMIWTSDQIRRIWTENMKIIYNNKKRHTYFNKEILSRLFFIICFS